MIIYIFIYFIFSFVILPIAFWIKWSSWNECSVTCGVGTRTSERICSDPDDTGGACGMDKETSRTQQCHAQQCRKFSTHWFSLVM